MACAPFRPPPSALPRARDKGLAVVLITNAPRPSPDVVAQLTSLGVPDAAWDAVVTSGDVTRDLIAAGPRKIYHLGPDRDFSIYDGLDVEMVEEFEASAVVCTGLFDDETEVPEDYAAALRRFRARDLPFICANPDIVVERGDRLIWCAGALARDYALLGGRTLISGKPHRPIYEASLKAAGRDARPRDRRARGAGHRRRHADRRQGRRRQRHRRALRFRRHPRQGIWRYRQPRSGKRSRRSWKRTAAGRSPSSRG